MARRRNISCMSLRCLCLGQWSREPLRNGSGHDRSIWRASGTPHLIPRLVFIQCLRLQYDRATHQAY